MENYLLDTLQQTDGQIQNMLPLSVTKSPTPLDTSLKWTPLALLVISDAVGLKTKNKLKQQVVHFIVAEAILNAILLPVKKAVNRERPNGDHKSFPSGHAATGFLGSDILHQELIESYPVASFSGYALSFVTCGLRLYHKKHWFSDVATGALLGILSAKLAGKGLKQVKKSHGNKHLNPGNLLM